MLYVVKYKNTVRHIKVNHTKDLKDSINRAFSTIPGFPIHFRILAQDVETTEFFDVIDPDILTNERILRIETENDEV